MTKTAKIWVTLWAVLQLGRLIAIPLILSVLAAGDSAVWMFPAMVDVVVAAGVPLAIWAVWRGQGVLAWVYILGWMLLSIFDHASAVTAFALAGVPTVFAKFGDQGFLAPMAQTLGDIVVIWALMRRPVRQHYTLQQ